MATITTGSLTYATVRDRLKGQNGVHESPAGSNRQKFGVWYGWNGVPWCAIFCSWGFHGSTGQMGGKAAGVWSLADRFKKQGRYGYTPKVGALAIFDNYKHVEFVVAVYSDHMICVGGNTSRPDGSNPWGGQVAIKKRYRSQMNGFCYPKYAGGTTTSTSTTQRTLEVDGYWGPNSTKALQEFLNRTLKTGLDVDGDFGKQTTNAVLRWMGLPQDWSLSSSDIKAIEKKVGTAQSGTWNRANGYDETSKAIQKWLNAHRT